MQSESGLKKAFITGVAGQDDSYFPGLAELIEKVVEYVGWIEFDAGKPDGAPRTWLDITCIQHLGCAPNMALEA